MAAFKRTRSEADLDGLEGNEAEFDEFIGVGDFVKRVKRYNLG